MTSPETPLSYEHAFAKLEEILEKLSASNTSLEEALNLYEEADRLIRYCNSRLGDAELRVDALIKNRAGGMAIGPDGRPSSQEFRPSGQ